MPRAPRVTVMIRRFGMIILSGGESEVTLRDGQLLDPVYMRQRTYISENSAGEKENLEIAENEDHAVQQSCYT